MTEFKGIAVAHRYKGPVVRRALHRSGQRGEAVGGALRRKRVEIDRAALAPGLEKGPQRIGLGKNGRDLRGMELHISVVPRGAQGDQTALVLLAEPVPECFAVCHASIEALVRRLKPLAALQVVSEN